MDWCSWMDLLSFKEMELIAREVGLIGPDGDWAADAVDWHWDGPRASEFERRCDERIRAKLADD